MTKPAEEARDRSSLIVEAFDAIEQEDPRVMGGLLALGDGTWEQAVMFALCKLAGENRALRARLEN